jgi:hypothetical protein
VSTVSTVPAAALVLTGVCSAACLLASGGDCTCRCRGRFHGLLAEVPIAVDRAHRARLVLPNDGAAADEDDAAAAVRMRAEGLSYRLIADRLGRSKTWAYIAVNGREPPRADHGTATH